MCLGNDYPFREINIKIIHCSKQRFPFLWGDYWVDNAGVLQIRVSAYVNPDHAMCCIIHEIMEAWRCFRKGVTLESIEDFDKSHIDCDDPGTLPDAPYHKEHMQSIEIEKLIYKQNGDDFNEYSKHNPIDLEEVWEKHLEEATNE
jgi:hypothetical protein